MQYPIGWTIEGTSQSFAAVLCDFKMPEMNGLELLTKIRNLNHEPKVPFILMTGGLDHLPATSPFQPQGILHKPFTPEDVTQALIHAMSAPVVYSRAQSRRAKDVGF